MCSSYMNNKLINGGHKVSLQALSWKPHTLDHTKKFVLSIDSLIVWTDSPGTKYSGCPGCCYPSLIYTPQFLKFSRGPWVNYMFNFLPSTLPPDNQRVFKTRGNRGGLGSDGVEIEADRNGGAELQSSLWVLGRGHGGCHRELPSGAPQGSRGHTPWVFVGSRENGITNRTQGPGNQRLSWYS